MKKIFFLIFIIQLFSCQSVKNSNNYLSSNKKFYNSFYNTNGNVFVLSSPNGALSSYIWSYSSNAIDVYSFNQGKIQSKKSHKIEGQDLKWLLNPSKDDTGLDECIAMDGFTLMYKVKNNESYIERKFPISLECLKNTSYETSFFKNLIQDIKLYQIGWKEVK